MTEGGMRVPSPFFYEIHHILSSGIRGLSNDHYYDDVPVEFLPDMLGSIQLYSEYHHGDNAPSRDFPHVAPLSIVYEMIETGIKLSRFTNQ